MPGLLRYCSVCGAEGLVPVMWLYHKTTSSGSNTASSSTHLLSCPQCKRGWLQRYSYDDWSDREDEPWDMYWWFLLEQGDMQQLVPLLEECPAPLDPQCNCAIHNSLRTATAYISSRVRSEETPLRQVPFTRLSLSVTEQGLTFKVIV